jgi:hypothetical protein
MLQPQNNHAFCAPLLGFYFHCSTVTGSLFDVQGSTGQSKWKNIPIPPNLYCIRLGRIFFELFSNKKCAAVTKEFRPSVLLHYIYNAI